MNKEDLKTMLKESLSIKVFPRFEGQVNGVKIQVDFENEELCSFFLWDGDNAGFVRASSQFWDEPSYIEDNYNDEGI